MHQPNYLPWIGLFSKVSLADCFVLYDTAQYGRKSTTARNKIRTSTGSSYLTVPVGKRPASTRICDVALPQNELWKERHWQMIHDNYVHTPFFPCYEAFFRDLYSQDYSYLSQLNEAVIRYLLTCFHIGVGVIRTSQLEVDPELHHTDLLIAYLKQLGADVYLSGPSGRNYLEAEKFARNGIDLKFFQFSPPCYRQRFPGFEPNMSAIDLLFNVGPESCFLIRKSGTMVDPEPPYPPVRVYEPPLAYTLHAHRIVE